MLAGFVHAKAHATLTLTIQIGALRKFQWAQHNRIRQAPHMPQLTSQPWLIQGSLRAGEQLELVANPSRHSRMPFVHLRVLILDRILQNGMALVGQEALACMQPGGACSRCLLRLHLLIMPASYERCERRHSEAAWRGNFQGAACRDIAKMHDAQL